MTPNAGKYDRSLHVTAPFHLFPSEDCCDSDHSFDDLCPRLLAFDLAPFFDGD